MQRHEPRFASILPRLVPLVLVALVTGAAPGPSAPQRCSAVLDRAVLESSLDLGTRFMLNHQREGGNFDYLYDWGKRALAEGDSSVRQAGAAWGLVLIDRYRPQAEVAAAADRALAFFDRHSVVKADGRRFVAYPGEPYGSTGTVALVALALGGRLREGGTPMSPEATAAARQKLDGYLTFLSRARRPDGLWPRFYDHKSGKTSGPPTPYYDGEALLALVQAARYLERDDLRESVIEAAEAGWQTYVAAALARERDPDETKGYYQWGSMAFYELALSGWDGTEKFGPRVLDLADWMIDVHRTLDRQRNTGYAYEGIIHAYDLARRSGADERAAKLRCTIERGLEKLTSWQVGSPIANASIRSRAGSPDPAALGGIQNHEIETELRIDVTQHQMHAVILALRYVDLTATPPAPAEIQAAPPAPPAATPAD